jgi:hypothetical protein
MKCKMCGETANEYSICDLCWLKFEAIDVQWKEVRQIRPHHIVNSIILIIIVLYLSSLGVVNALIYVFMKLTGG